VLAEAFLMDVDDELTGRGIEFVRFVDDFALFASDQESARQHVRSLDECLGRRGLRLNAAKTSIRTVTISDGMAIDAPEMLVTRTGAEQPRSRNGRAAVRRQSQRQDQQNQQQQQYGGSTTQRRRDRRSGHDGYGRMPVARLAAAARDARTVDFKAFTGLLEAAHEQDASDGVILCSELRTRNPHCTPYFVEFLIQEAEALAVPVRDVIADGVAAELGRGAARAEFETLFLLRLLGADGYARPDAVFRYLVGDNPMSPLLRRSGLDALTGCATPAQIAHLVEHLGTGDPWTRRALARMACRCPDGGTALPAMPKETDVEPDVFLSSLLRRAVES
jgi:hypothetical protein